MGLEFREWVTEQELNEADFWKMLRKARHDIPRSPRELGYALLNFKGSFQDQIRRAYQHGQKAAFNDSEHGTQSLNPFRNETGPTDPSYEPFFKAWEEGYASRKPATTAPVPQIQQTGQ